MRPRLVSATWTWEVGGNCSIRGATRRRHAVMGLLMLPNPQLGGLVGRCWRVGGCSLWMRLGLGCAIAARFSDLDMGGWGELHYMGVRHAGDATLGAFM